MGLLNLGTVEFKAFEIPAAVHFGGDQRVAIHKLIGGTRVIDALGRDDTAITWSGILSGSGAADRARSLDAMRTSGDVQPLNWDAFCYQVVVETLTFEYCSPWWIPYKIKCVVQIDLAQADSQYTPPASVAVLSDLTAAAQFLDPDLALSITATANLFGSESPSPHQAQIALTAAKQDVQEGINATQIGLSSSDITQVVSAAGSLAQLSCAQGYLDRSAVNMTLAGV